jgi:tetratricopeptide (TPR) repeat protein
LGRLIVCWGSFGFERLTLTSPGSEEATIDAVLEPLFNFSMATRTSDEAQFIIHPLIHTWARERLTDENRRMKTAEAVRILGDALGPLNECGRFERSRELWHPFEHVNECTKHALDYGILEMEGIPEMEKTLDGILKMAVESVCRDVYFKLVDHSDGRILFKAETRPQEDSVAFLKRGLAAQEKLFGLGHPVVFQTVVDLHQVAISRKAYQSVIHGFPTSCIRDFGIAGTFFGSPQKFDLAPKAQESIGVPQDLHETISGIISHRLSNIQEFGVALFDSCQVDEVERHFRLLLTTVESLGISQDKRTTYVYALVTVLVLQDKLDEAEKLLRTAFAALREYHWTVSRTFELGAAFVNEHKFSEAERFFRLTLEVQERILGEDDKRTISTLHNVACALLTQFRFEEAETYFRRELEALQRTRGPEDVKTIVVIAHMSTVLSKLGRFDEAEDLARTALEKTLDLGDLKTIECASLLVSVAILLKQDQFDKAEKLLRRVYEVQKRILGVDHQDTIKSLNKLQEVQKARTEIEPRDDGEPSDKLATPLLTF